MSVRAVRALTLPTNGMGRSGQEYTKESLSRGRRPGPEVGYGSCPFLRPEGGEVHDPKHCLRAYRRRKRHDVCYWSSVGS
jgi:hypothetical protein